MLRALFVILIVANGAYFAWTRGMLAQLGFMPSVQREPERVATQIAPNALRVLKTEDAKKVELLAAKPLECLQSGFIEAARMDALKAALPSLLGSATWQFDALREDARWIVYMGKYPGAGALAKKKTELRGLGVPFEPLRRSDLEPGIAVGSANNKDDAEELLLSLNKKGIKTAKVVQEIAPLEGQRLRLPAVDDALRPKLDELRAAGGIAAWLPCKAA